MKTVGFVELIPDEMMELSGGASARSFLRRIGEIVIVNTLNNYCKRKTGMTMDEINDKAWDQAFYKMKMAPIGSDNGRNTM